MSGLVLSLFPGIGLLDMAFEEEGFCVVRGPDVLWGGDVKRFHPPAGAFDGVIGGPPCQAFSRLRHFVEFNGLEVAENLIPEFLRVVSEAQPRWFLMENVPQAPLPEVDGYHVHARVYNNRWFGGEQQRERRISFGTRDGLRLLPQPDALMPSRWAPTVVASGGQPPGYEPTERHRATRKGKSAMGFKTTAYLGEALRLQGLSPDFLDHAPFTVAGKIKVVGNGVPLPLGRALARAVKAALEAAA